MIYLTTKITNTDRFRPYCSQDWLELIVVGGDISHQVIISFKSPKSGSYPGMVPPEWSRGYFILGMRVTEHCVIAMKQEGVLYSLGELYIQINASTIYTVR